MASKETPGVGSTGRTGPMGARGERPTATPTASTAPMTTAPTIPMRPSSVVDDRIGTERLERPQVVGRQSRLAADHLGGDEQCRHGRDDPEGSQGDGLGLDGALGLGKGRGADDGGREVGGQHALELGVDLAEVVAARDLDARDACSWSSTPGIAG